VLLKKLDHPRIETAQGGSAISAGYAQIHISEELLEIRIISPFLPKLM
jgi:hypothetical protein